MIWQLGTSSNSSNTVTDTWEDMAYIANDQTIKDFHFTNSVTVLYYE